MRSVETGSGKAESARSGSEESGLAEADSVEAHLAGGNCCSYTAGRSPLHLHSFTHHLHLHKGCCQHVAAGQNCSKAYMSSRLGCKEMLQGSSVVECAPV